MEAPADPSPYQPGKHALTLPEGEQGMCVIRHRPLDAMIALLWVPAWIGFVVGISYYFYGPLFRVATFHPGPFQSVTLYAALPATFVIGEIFLLFFYLYHRDSRVEIGNGHVRVIKHGHLVEDRGLAHFTKMRTRYTWRRAGYNLCFEGDTNVPLPFMLSWKYAQIRRALKREKKQMESETPQ